MPVKTIEDSPTLQSVGLRYGASKSVISRLLRYQACNVSIPSTALVFATLNPLKMDISVVLVLTSLSLPAAMTGAWSAAPGSYLEELLQALLARCQAVLDAKDMYTSYWMNKRAKKN